MIPWDLDVAMFLLDHELPTVYISLSVKQMAGTTGFLGLGYVSFEDFGVYLECNYTRLRAREDITAGCEALLREEDGRRI